MTDLWCGRPVVLPTSHNDYLAAPFFGVPKGFTPHIRVGSEHFVLNPSEDVVI